MAKISGKIVDIDNEPLVGANITLKTGVKANKVGVSSDLDGNFSLDRDDFSNEDSFEVSYIGFLKQTFLAKDLQNKKIVLKEAIDVLDEVVLFGGKPKKTENKEIENKFKENLAKNKYYYAGSFGLLGLALILVSIKSIK
jgi:hypothetical protein